MLGGELQVGEIVGVGDADTVGKSLKIFLIGKLEKILNEAKLKIKLLSRKISFAVIIEF